MAFVALRPGENGRLALDGERTAALGHRVALPDGDADGVYAGWRWDGGSLAVETDRYGLYPLFVSADGARWLLGSSIDELLEQGAPRALDYDALSVFLRIGFFLEDDTPFRAIRALPPRPRFGIQGGRPYLAGTLPSARLQPLGREAAVDAYIDLFRQAIARRLPSGAFQLPLSGGRDSRHILLALVERGLPPAACVTVEHFPPRGNDDVLVAAELCERIGAPHIVLRQPVDREALEREKNRVTHYCTDEHVQFVVLGRHLARASAETYDGIAGDVLSQSSYLTPVAHAVFSGSDAAAAARHVLDAYGTAVSDRALAHLVVPSLFDEVPRERAVARLARAIAPHMSAPNPVASFFFWNRTRREVALAPFALMRGIRVHAPYLDRDLFDLLSGLPASLQMDRRLHTDAIARAYPAYRDLPYERRSRPERPGSARATAAGLMRTVLRSRRILRAPTLLPSLAAAAAGGTAGRLWFAPLAFYLAQLADVAGDDVVRDDPPPS